MALSKVKMISRTVYVKGVGMPAHRLFLETSIPVMPIGGDANNLVPAGFRANKTECDNKVL